MTNLENAEPALEVNPAKPSVATVYAKTKPQQLSQKSEHLCLPEPPILVTWPAPLDAKV